MTRIRQQNVTAAQWSSNGEALGALDLTQPEPVDGQRLCWRPTPRSMVKAVACAASSICTNDHQPLLTGAETMGRCADTRRCNLIFAASRPVFAAAREKTSQKKPSQKSIGRRHR